MGKSKAFDEIYMGLAREISHKSHCVKKQVGAVISKEKRVIGMGYNNPPAGTYNCDEKWPGVGCPRTHSGGCWFSLHAEQNAILFAIKNKIDLEGATLYITLSPCLPCSRIIFTSGIKRVVYSDSYAEYKGLTIEEGIEFLKEFGVKVEKFDSGNIGMSTP